MNRAGGGRGAGRFRYGAVLLLTLAVAIFALVAPDGSAVRTLELLASGATLLVAVLTSRAPAATRRSAAVSVTIVVAGAGIAAAIGAAHAALTFAGSAVLLAVTAGVILAGLVRLIIERGVVLQAVFGALAVYVLVGLTFSFVIGALATGVSGPYFASGNRRHAERTRLLQLHDAHHDRIRRLHGGQRAAGVRSRCSRCSSGSSTW